MSNFIRAASLLLVLFCVAASGVAQEKQEQREKKKKLEQPSAVGAIVARLPAEYDPASWKEYKSDAGGFSILFPGKPREETQKIRDGGGRGINLNMINLHEMAIYSVLYLDAPPPPSQSSVAPRSMLDSSAAQAAQMFNAEPLEQKEITLDGHPGRFVRQRLPDGLIMRLKFYVVGQRLYQLMITTPTEQGATDDQRRFYAETASKFLDSFKLAPTATASAAQSAGGADARREAKAQGGGLVRAEDDYPPATVQKELPRAPIRGGILNGKAISKPQPAYPAAAAGVSGMVEVAVVINEEGRVIEAEALSGPEELRAAAVEAARRARFPPTRLSGQPVKIPGRLTYNFVPR